MAWDYYIEPELNCVFVTHYDEFTITEVGEHFQQLMADPNYLPEMNLIRDLRQINIPKDYDYKSISSEAKKVFSRFDQRMGHSKLAIVVSGQHDYIIAHQWIVTGRLSTFPVERKPFRDMEKAKEWIGISIDYEIKMPS